MRTDANWCAKTGLVLLVLVLVLAAVSCGGGSGSVGLDPSQNNSVTRGESDATRSTGVLVTEDEIAGLPVWQQEMLSDPGWNAPFIPPAEGTAIEAPTNELLESELQGALERGNTYEFRGLDTADTERGVSWDDNGDFNGVDNVGKGEYEGLAPGATPPYGCNNSPANSANGNAVEDIISNTNMVVPQRISYVLEGLSAPNYFNRVGGAGNDSLSSVYQLFSTLREADPETADPTDPNSPEFAELSYRADLAPGVGPGGDCSAAEAFSVAGNIWFRFNATTNALPGQNETALYNFLIAPSGAVSGAEISSKNTTGRWQPFYFGTVSPCFGGGAIVSIESSDSDCDDFNTLFESPQSAFFFTNPIYGVLLQRWTQSQLSGMDGPWESEFGWPVYGPIIYGNGSQFISVLGSYYVFGMWFEKGFVWWVDYDQELYPGTSDEAQAYRYTGTHVYCTDGTYEPIGTPILYGGTGDLGVSVVVDSFRYDAADPWTAAPLSDDGTHYTIPLPSDVGLATVNVAAHAHGFGGVANEDCLYKYYVWAWRDGSITAAGAAYDPEQQYRNHTYGSLARNMENNYVIRVQVTDASFDLEVTAEEVRAYGDALPLHIGHGGGGGGGEILVIRDDGGDFNANYDALISDLEDIGAAFTAMDYTSGIDGIFASEGDPYKVAIWYRGGQGDDGESGATYNDPWGSKENELFGIVNNGGSGAGLLLMSQSHGANNPFNTPGFFINDGWTFYTNFALLGAGTTSDIPWCNNEGQPSGFFYPFFPFLANPNIVKGQGTHLGGEFNTYSVNSAERHDSNGGSGKVPITFAFGTTRQMCVNASALNIPGISPTYTGGICLPTTFGIGQLSWGNTAAPGTGGTGPGRYYSFGQSWGETEVTLSNAGGPGEMTRAELLQNMLSWCDETLTFGGGGGGGGNFSEYVGPPEIVQVTPISWAGEEGQISAGAISLTGVTYPDPTGTDIYRSSPNSGNENFIVRTAGPNEDGLSANDVDFQFAGRYRFIHDPDDSLRTFSGAGPGGSNLTGDETLVGSGGLLVDQGNHSGFGGGSGTQWKRVDSTNPDYTDWNTNADGVGSTDWEDVLGELIYTPFSGYWTTTDEIIDTNADELDDVADTKVTASYGTQPPHLTYSGVEEPLTFEAVAHWDITDANVAGNLFWSMYPGHTTYDSLGQLYGEDISWRNFVGQTDIDPSHPNPAGLPYDRDSWQFLQHGFTYSELLAEGRVISEFDYSAINGWHGDHNNNFILGEVPGDKFPVRARLITDLAMYGSWWNNFGPTPGPNPYPNHWPEASDPVTQAGGTFTEGGCYIVDDTGAGFGTAPSITTVESPVAVAPGYNIRWTGTYPAAPSWQMSVTFTIDIGVVLPASVQLDLNADLPVDATNFDNDLSVGSFLSGTFTQVVNFTSAQVSDGWANGDLNILGIRAANPLGEDFANYTIPIWLGDVIRYDNFENMEVSPNVPPVPQGINRDDWLGTANAPGPNRIVLATGPNGTINSSAGERQTLQNFPNNYWTHHRGSYNNTLTNAALYRTFARAQRTQAGGGPNRPHWIEHPNMGNMAIYWDQGNVAPFTYENNVFSPIFPPQTIVPSNDPVWVHFRGTFITELNFDWITVTSPRYQFAPVGGSYTWISSATWSWHGPTPVPTSQATTVRSRNLTAQATANAWTIKNPATQAMRPGIIYRSDTSIVRTPGGVMVDNLLQTHASTVPPYI